MVLDPQVSTLVFDFDGTLFHLPVDWAGVRGALRLADRDPIGPLLQRFMDTDDRAGLEVVTRHELDAVRAGSFTAGAHDALRSSANVAVVTRNSRRAVEAALGDLADGLLIVGREDVRRLKPDPEGLLQVLAHFRVEPAAAALVGDTYHDVDAARAAGMRSIVVHNALLEYAPAGADCYVDDLTVDLVAALEVCTADR